MKYILDTKLGQVPTKAEAHDILDSIFSTNHTVKRVIWKGGQGSGNFDHAGRPGLVGGSAESANYKLVQVNLLTGNPIADPDPHDVAILDKSVKLVNKTIKSLDLSNNMFTIMPLIVGESCGSANVRILRGPLKGQRTTCISPQKVDAAIKKNGDALKSWNGLQTELNHDNYLEHIVIHEIGHIYWDKNGLESKWPFGTSFKDAPGYGSYYHLPNETFADTFANFVTGADLDPKVEDWFMENVI